MRGWRGYGGSLSEAHIVAPRDPSSSGLQAQLSRTQNWGRELPGFPLVGAGWEGEGERKRGKKGKVCKRVLLGEMPDCPDQQNGLKTKRSNLQL